MRVITHIPEEANDKQRESLMLLVARALARYQIKEKKKDLVSVTLVQEVRVYGQLDYKIKADVQKTKTGYSVKTWVEDLL